MRLWYQTVIVAAVATLLVILQAVPGDARHMCITVDGECGSIDDAMITTCSREDTDEIMLPTFSSGSVSEDEDLHCYTLESALAGMQSNDTLLLSPGTHVLSDSAVSVISNLSEISIIGNLSNRNQVVITCAEGVGLGFENITGMTLSGFTMDGCSLSGKTVMSFDYSNKFFPDSIIHDVVGAVFLLYSSDLIMKNVTVQNSHGFGIIGWNLLGDTHFHGVNLLSNSPKSCLFEIDDHHDTIPGQNNGGGAFIVYQDFGKDIHLTKFADNKLSFDQGLIANNFGCRQGFGTSVFNQLFREVTISDLNQYLGSAGGLSVVFGQSHYHVNATITSYTFHNNTNLYGSAGLMVLLYELANRTDVYIIDSSFMDNGVTTRNVKGGPMTGREGGIFILYYVPISNIHINKHIHMKYLDQLPSKVHVHDSIFTNNTAQVGGGICVLSFSATQSFIQDELDIKNCTFVDNNADHGSAIYAKQISYSGFQEGLKFLIENINVTRNRGSLEAISLNELNVSFSGTNIFMSNTVTAMSLQKAIIMFSGNNLFKRNIGNRGGALHLKTAESYIIVRNETSVSFIDNVGRISGGAIFARFDRTIPTRYDCFLFVEELDPLCHITDDCLTYTVNVDFTNNTAPLGSAIFGSTLYHCAWSNGVHYINFDDRSAHVIAEDIVDSLHSADTWLHFNPDVTENNVINTLPEFIVSQDHNFELTFNVTPGGHFTLYLKAFDHLLQSVPLTILSHITTLNNEDVTTAASSVGETDRYLLVGADEYTEVPVNVYGQEDAAYLISIAGIVSQINFDVRVNLINCSAGFRFNNDAQYPSCECDIEDSLSNVRCNDDGTITHIENHWIGKSESGEYIQHKCIHNYCRLNVTTVNLDYPNEQCEDKREGILCGGCPPGYSRLLGSTRCRVCPKSSILLFAFICIFAVLGIALVALIKFFNITITDGYINGFIFYANIVIIYFNTLPFTQIKTIYPLYVLIAFLNLNFGIEACFYHGMTQLDLIGLTLLFPIYLLAILLVIVLFKEYFGIYLTKFRKWFNQRYKKKADDAVAVDKSTKTSSNIIQVLVTLLLISYTRIIQTCFDILEVVVFQTPSGPYTVWGGDPNQRYFKGIHILLVFIAIGLLFILVPFPIMVAFPTFVLKWRRTHNLKPFVDAFIAPFGDKRQFWIGLRLFCRLAIYFLVRLRSSTYNYLVLAIILLFILVLQSCLWPYRTTGRNLLDLSLMVNLTILAIVTIYVDAFYEDLKLMRNVLIIFASMLIAELFFLICCYVLSKFSITRKIYKSVTKKAKEIAKKVMMKYQDKTSEKKKKNKPQYSVPNRDEITHMTVRFNSDASNVLRESLLDETIF